MLFKPYSGLEDLSCLPLNSYNSIKTGILIFESAVYTFDFNFYFITTLYKS